MLPEVGGGQDPWRRGGQETGLGIGRMLHMNTEITNICDSMGKSVSQELKLRGQKGVTESLDDLHKWGDVVFMKIRLGVLR